MAGSGTATGESLPGHIPGCMHVPVIHTEF